MKYREKAYKVYPRKTKTTSVASRNDLRMSMELSRVIQENSIDNSIESYEHSHNSEAEIKIDLVEGETYAERKACLRKDLDAIILLFLTPESQKEVNLPQNVVKNVLSEIRDSENYHPDVLKPVLEKTYEMMKTSSFPNFYRQAVDRARQMGKDVLENGYYPKRTHM
ncbi:MAG: hypothetical protein SGCHY_003631 [Lobulomycetales sp.]